MFFAFSDYIACTSNSDIQVVSPAMSVQVVVAWPAVYFMLFCIEVQCKPREKSVTLSSSLLGMEKKFSHSPDPPERATGPTQSICGRNLLISA